MVPIIVWWIPVAAVAGGAVIYGVIEGDDDEPASPTTPLGHSILRACAPVQGAAFLPSAALPLRHLPTFTSPPPAPGRPGAERDSPIATPEVLFGEVS